MNTWDGLDVVMTRGRARLCNSRLDRREVGKDRALSTTSCTINTDTMSEIERTSSVSNPPEPFSCSRSQIYSSDPPTHTTTASTILHTLQ